MLKGYVERTLTKYLPFACTSLVGLLLMAMYYILDSLTTTHGEASLPTSTAQHGGLREVGARGRSLGIGSWRPSMLMAARGFVLV
jgi:hypothetical protein